MTFRRGARLNPGQVRDARGQGGGGGLGFPGGLGMPGGSRSSGGGIGVPAGGGLAGIVVVIVIIGIFFFLNGGLGGSATNGGLQPGPLSTSLASCQTGEDANAREDCRIVGYVNSVNAYWAQEYPKLAGGQAYPEAQTTIFTDS